MADLQENGQPPKHESNGAYEIERLSLQVKQLQGECENLHRSLTRSEEERNHYLKAIYAYEKAKLDFDELRKAESEDVSAGPVELME
jgi:hypothetical protein